MSVWANTKTIKAGDWVRVDGGFKHTACCLAEGTERIVEESEGGELYIRCAAGHHYLHGQLADDGSGDLVGLYPVSDEPTKAA
jgi:hypothetical protein